MNTLLMSSGEKVGINILVAFIILIVSYLIGSIQFSILLGKIVFHQDPRDYGSGNAGGTNVGRIWGKRFGVLIILLDMLKTIGVIYAAWAILTFVPMINGMPLLVSTPDSLIPTIKSTYVITWPIYYLSILGVMLGHCHPLFYKFKGGKGAANFYGICLSTSWLISLPMIFVFAYMLKKKKYVSLAVLVGASCFVLIAWLICFLNLARVIPDSILWLFMYGKNSLKFDYVYPIILTLGLIILSFEHQGNIQRLFAGQERRITWLK